MKRHLSAVLFAALAAISFSTSTFAQSAPTQGSWGFNWYGTNTAALSGSGCEVVNWTDTDTDDERALSLWSPPTVNGRSTSYSLNSFGAVVSVYSPTYRHSGNPATDGDYQVVVYDSFERMRADPLHNFRARYDFNRPFTNAVTFQPVLDAGGTPVYGRYCISQGCPANMQTPYSYANFNLAQASAVYYQTATGTPTSTPFRPSSGSRLWFTIMGVNFSDPAGYLCVSRTRADVPNFKSPPPAVPINVPMTAAQCADAGMPYPCHLPLAHSSYRKWGVGVFENICDPDSAFVNSTPDVSPPGYEPYWNTSGQGFATCGYPNHAPCCERAIAGYVAYRLGATPKVLPLSLNAYTIAAAIDVCPGSGC